MTIPAGAPGVKPMAPGTSSPSDPGHCAWPARPLARRYNRVASAIVIALLVTAGTAAGSVIRVAVATAGGEARSLETAFAPAVYGAVTGLALSTIGVLWGWFGGARAIIRLHNARLLQPTDDPALFEAINDVARLGGVPPPDVYLIDDSALNCCATGRAPRHASIALTRGLREHLTPAELRAVLAHEIAHIRRFDTRFALVMASMVGLFALACDWLWRVAFQAGRSAKRSTDTIKAWGWVSIAFFVLAGLMSAGAFVIGLLVQFCVRRDREYRADADAAELTGDPGSLCSALRKLAADADPLVDVANRATAHLFIVNPLRRMRESGQSIDSPFCSHPPIAKRIARLEELDAAMHARAPSVAVDAGAPLNAEPPTVSPRA